MIQWRDCTLGDLLHVKHGFAFLGEYFGKEGAHVVLTPGNFLEEGGFIEKTDKAKWYRGPVPADYVLSEGDLIVAMTEQAEGLLGSSAIIPRSGMYLHNQRLGLVQIRDLTQADQNFIYYLFNSKTVRQQIRGSASGTKIRHTSPSRIAEVKVRIPTQPVQRRIAGILSAYDELIENSQRRIKILETMARTLYREWFVHFRFPGHEKIPLVTSSLGEIPQGWEVGRLDDVLVLQRGFDLPKSDRVDGTVPIYAATGVTGFHNEVKVKAPGVVTGRSGTIGDVLYVQEDFWPLNTTLWVKEFPKAEPLYAFYVLSALDLKQFNSGAAVPTLNRNDIHGFDTLIPPRPLQKKFQEIVGAMLGQTRILELKIQNLRKARDLLMPRLLSGQVSLYIDAAEQQLAEAQAESLQATPALVVSMPTTRKPAIEPVQLQVAEAAPPAYAADKPPDINGTERTDVLCAIRALFSDGVARDRATAIRDLAHALGYQRTGSRIHEVLATDLLTAVRRGIVVNEGGMYSLGFRTLTDCTRDSLKNNFESAIGRGWINRDDAIRTFARWLGFARVGKVIDDTARSLINGLIREGRLETDGSGCIRKAR